MATVDIPGIADPKDDCPAANTLEHAKFARDQDGKVVVRVADSNAMLGAMSGIVWDSFSVSYPNDTTEVWAFFDGGLLGTNTANVTIVFTDNTKCEVSTFVRVIP